MISLTQVVVKSRVPERRATETSTPKYKSVIFAYRHRNESRIKIFSCFCLLESIIDYIYYVKIGLECWQALSGCAASQFKMADKMAAEMEIDLQQIAKMFFILFS